MRHTPHSIRDNDNAPSTVSAHARRRHRVLIARGNAMLGRANRSLVNGWRFAADGKQCLLYDIVGWPSLDDARAMALQPSTRHKSAQIYDQLGDENFRSHTQILFYRTQLR